MYKFSFASEKPKLPNPLKINKMPELAELKLTADYINHVSNQVKYNRISKNPAHKGSLNELVVVRFSIRF